MSTRRSRASAADGRRSERGTGVISSTFGLLVVLVLLLFAVQVTYDLYATSAVTSAAYDAARIVAGADGGSASVAEAEGRARSALGRYAPRVTFTWAMDGDFVELRVVGRNPGFLPTAIRQPLGIDTVDRTVRVRVEALR